MSAAKTLKATPGSTGRANGVVERFLAIRVVRYGLVSGVAIAVSQCVLALTFGLLRWDAVPANVMATGVATLPSYVLNRQWVWGHGGRSHVLREIVPFWVLAFLSLVASTAAAAYAASWAAMVTSDHRSRTLMVMAATLLAFGVLWVVRFLVMNRFLFAGSPNATIRPSRLTASPDLVGAVSGGPARPDERGRRR